MKKCAALLTCLKIWIVKFDLHIHTMLAFSTNFCVGQ